jgi:hypothetical protein
MPVTLNAHPATDKQRAFLKTLSAERDWLDRLQGQEWETAQDCVIPDHFISSSEASAAISALLACPRNNRPVAAPRAGFLEGIPFSKYAVVEDGVLTFWEVKAYKGVAYLRLLIGAPGQFNRVKVGFDRAARVAAEIKTDVLAAAQRFATHYTCCAVCGAELSDETSVALGLGPVCRRRFAL